MRMPMETLCRAGRPITDRCTGFQTGLCDSLREEHKRAAARVKNLPALAATAPVSLRKPHPWTVASQQCCK